MSELRIESVTVNRSGGPVVTEVSLEVPAGKVATLVGPNGAGKTTLLESISGLVPVASGRVLLDGVEIHRLGKVRRTRLGLVHVEQGRTVFPSLTVDENLRVVTGSKSEIDSCFELFPELEERRSSQTVLLSGGEQQMVVLARAFIARPRFLLIDEMSLGLAPAVFSRLLPAVSAFAQTGVGVLLVEQFAQMALGISDAAAVLAGGRIRYSGTAQALIDSPEALHRAYMGDEIT